jgi:glutathione synthase/RimK-type ligase-like ATP-grasp enzyme
MNILYPYNPNSESAKALAAALDLRRAKHEGKPLKAKLVINWGASKINRQIDAERVLNKPEAVAAASNKLSSFKAFKVAELDTPEFTESKEEATKWLASGATVVARTILTGHSGAGIIVADPENQDELPDAKLYTKYIPKKEEYRVHVANGAPFYWQRKARKKDVPDDQVNWRVRNHANGFVYQNLDVREDVRAGALAVRAVKALGLDFGAVDLVYNQKKDSWFVLEVNTACGLEGSSVGMYAEAIGAYL